MSSANAQKGDNGRDLFDVLEEAEGESTVVVSLYPDPNSGTDFDYEYSIQVVDSESEKATLLATSEANGGVEFMKVKLVGGGENLEAYELDIEYGTTYLGNVMGIRESR